MCKRLDMNGKGKSKVQPTFHSHSKNKEKGKEVWEDDVVAVLFSSLNLDYRLDSSLFLSVSQAEVTHSLIFQIIVDPCIRYYHIIYIVEHI